MNESEREIENLHALLYAFNTKDLGDGDEIAGMNLLAAMALTVANLARNGEGLLFPNGRHVQVGCSFLTCGSLTSRLVHDEIIAPISDMQSNLLANLANLEQHDKKTQLPEPGQPRRMWTLEHATPGSAGESALFNLMSTPTMEDRRESDEVAWTRVITHPPYEQFYDLLNCHRIFLSCTTAKELMRQLKHMHRRNGIVSISVNSPKSVIDFSDPSLAIMEGANAQGSSFQHVTARLMVADWNDALAEANFENGDKFMWLGRMLWLVQDRTGPEPPSLHDFPDKGRLPNVITAFKNVLHHLFAWRLAQNYKYHQLQSFERNFATHQEEWMKFLQQMESVLPGISGHARNLAMSLFFGLHAIAQTCMNDKAPKLFPAGFAAFARLLIKRMANKKAMIGISHEDTRKNRIKQQILSRLEGRELSTRDIYRQLHLRASDCQEALREMLNEKLVLSHNDSWSLTGKEGIALPAGQQKTLEV